MCFVRPFSKKGEKHHVFSCVFFKMMDDEVEKRSKEQRVSYAPYSKDASALVTDVRPVSCYAESKYNEKLMPLQERRAPRYVPWKSPPSARSTLAIYDF